MYGYFKGTIEEKYDDHIVFEAGNIGYNIFVSNGKAYEMAPVGEEMKIYTYTAVKEDSICLYGFDNKAELELFKKLITVSGVGPKGALSILSILNADALRMAIFSGDAKSISKAPGVGSKTAERIIIDLKDKIKAEDVIASNFTELKSADNNRADINEAIEALSALGYSSIEAKKAVMQASEDGAEGSDALLKAALKYM